MEFAIITGPTCEIAKARIASANRRNYGIEIRIDLFKELDLPSLEALRKMSLGKVIFTLRSRKEGGNFIGSEDKKQKQILNLLSLKPDYLEIDYSISPDFIASISQMFPHTKMIFSYYDLHKTPKNLELVLEKMSSQFAYAYKICTAAQSLSDSYKMLRFVQKSCKNGMRIIGLCVGNHGRITQKKESLEVGNYLHYTLLTGHLERHFA